MAKVWDSELVEIMARHYGLAPPTHGEKWLAKAYKRLEGWCATRGWKCGPARLIGKDQYEVWIGDRTGREASLAFDMEADEAFIVSESGIRHDFDAVTFDLFMAPHGLATKPVVSKRQFSFCFAGA